MSIFRFLYILPKIIYFNFRFLPFRVALKLPIFLDYKTKVVIPARRGSIKFTDYNIIRPGLIRLGIGYGSFELGRNRSSFFKIEESGCVVFQGKCNIDAGFRIVASRNSLISFGRNFHSNAGLLLSAANIITIGNNVGMGWECTVIDGDGHPIVDITTNAVVNSSKPITINDSTWIASKVSILKGVSLAANTIVPYGTILTKSCISTHCIFGGLPNRILKEKVSRIDKLKI